MSNRTHTPCGTPTEGNGSSGVYSCPRCCMVVAPSSTTVDSPRVRTLAEREGVR